MCWIIIAIRNPPPFTLSLNTGWKLALVFSSKATNNWYGIDGVQLSWVSSFVCRGFAVLCVVCPTRLQLILSLHQLWAFLPECVTARPSRALSPKRSVHCHNLVLPLVLPPSWSAPLPSPLPILQTSRLPPTAQWLSDGPLSFRPILEHMTSQLLTWLPLEAVLLHSQTSCLVNKEDYTCIKGVENAISAFSTMK